MTYLELVEIGLKVIQIIIIPLIIGYYTLARRVSTLEAKVGQLPSGTAYHELSVRLAEMNGTLLAMNATIEAMQESQNKLYRSIERHEQHLLGQSK